MVQRKSTFERPRPRCRVRPKAVFHAGEYAASRSSRTQDETSTGHRTTAFSRSHRWRHFLVRLFGLTHLWMSPCLRTATPRCRRPFKSSRACSTIRGRGGTRRKRDTKSLLWSRTPLTCPAPWRPPEHPFALFARVSPSRRRRGMATAFQSSRLVPAAPQCPSSAPFVDWSETFACRFCVKLSRSRRRPHGLGPQSAFL